MNKILTYYDGHIYSCKPVGDSVGKTVMVVMSVSNDVVVAVVPVADDGPTMMMSVYLTAGVASMLSTASRSVTDILHELLAGRLLKHQSVPLNVASW